MNWSESFVYDYLCSHSENGSWKFFEVSDESGKTMPQAKFYSQYGYWVAYPDFELLSSNKPILLVEVKGYDGYFYNRNNFVGMKLRNFKSYQKVRLAERTDVRICFVISINGTNVIYWDTIDKISMFDNYIEEIEYSYYDVYKKLHITKREKFIFWDSALFTEGIHGLASIKDEF